MAAGGFAEPFVGWVQPHPGPGPTAQAATGERLRGYAELFVEGKEAVEIGLG